MTWHFTTHRRGVVATAAMGKSSESILCEFNLSFSVIHSHISFTYRDAWSPLGFCSRHGGPSSSAAGGSGCCGGGGLAAEPSVLGSVQACADYLVRVVKDGVEGGYQRANPQFFLRSASSLSSSEIMTNNGNKLKKKKAREESAAATLGCRSDSVLPEGYDEDDGGRERRKVKSLRRGRSLERRNTVADVETAPTATSGSRRPGPPSPVTSPVASPLASFGEDMEEDGEEDEGSSDDPISNAAAMITATNDDERNSGTRNYLHEMEFDPAMASASKTKRDGSAMSVDDNSNASSSGGSDKNVFDPVAASSSKSSLSGIQPAAKKARAPDNRHSAVTVKTPARALGDLGREGHGLFLVLHCDDIHMGGGGIGSSHHSHQEVINALKELYSTPGGGGGGSDNVGDRSAAAAATAGSGGDHNLPVSVGGGNRLTRQHRLLLGPRMGGVGGLRYSLFRAPHAEAILDKIVRIVKKHGDLIVWGNQEIVAEIGDVASNCWRDGDPQSSTLAGAAMLNRAKILTSRGLVCSIKTREELRNEQIATSILKLIGWVASSCDPLCDRVSSGLSSGSVLTPLLRNDLKLPYTFVKAWHSLLLTLLAVPAFKAAMANSYCDTYRAVTAEYARGVGLIERSSYTLSVQFLNRVSYVTDLVRERNLLSKLCRCLLETLRSASFVPGSPGSPPPAGASTDMMTEMDRTITPSSSLAAAILALLGFFSMEGGGEGGDDDEAHFARLDSEINDLLFHGIGEIGMDVGGGDSRHHGRTALAVRGDSVKDMSNRTRNLLERTAALVPPTLDPLHTVLSHRRHSVCISDLKCVLNVEGMSRIIASFPIDRMPPSSSTAKSDGQIYRDNVKCDCALDDWIKVSVTQRF